MAPNFSRPEPKWLDKKVIVNYIPAHWNQKSLQQFLQVFPHGCYHIEFPVHSGGISHGKTKSYAFIEFDTTELADKACELLNELHVEGKKLKCTKARVSGDILQDTNLRVDFMPEEWTETQMRQYFGEFGRVITARVVRPERPGNYKAGCVYGYVRMSHRNEAKNILTHYLHQDPCMIRVQLADGQQLNRSNRMHYPRS